MSISTETVLLALEQAKVRYLIVGGVAVVLHGVLRTTLDLDLVVQLESDNIDRALSGLAELGLVPRAPVPITSFRDEALRKTWRREKNMQVFSLWHPESPAFAVDLFIYEPFDFENAYKRSGRVPVAGFSASVLGLGDLIDMKSEAGRELDLDDLRALKAILENRS